MGRNRHRDERKDRLPPFVPLLIDTLNQPAWRAMSHGAKVLYIALKKRYNVKLHNNGRLFLSQRCAKKELRSHWNQIARWYRELQHFGFVVMQSPGFLGVEGKGQSPRWRLTELGYMNDPPTREYQKWDGTRFKDKPQRRGPRQKEQNPVSEITHTPCVKSLTKCRERKHSRSAGQP